MTQMNSPVTPTAPRNVTITRTFDAPRDLVWKMWTEPEHLKRWWGPYFFSNPLVEIDLRPGGYILIHMQAPDGTIYPDKAELLEVVPPEKLVFNSKAFEGEDGVFMLEVLNTITFAEKGGKTVLTMDAKTIRVAPEAEGALMGMEEGWNMSFDTLSALLAQVKTVTSKDGTTITYDEIGEGEPVILVTGALGTRPRTRKDDLATMLTRYFRVIDYDRRGRGDSGDTLPYAVEREIEDIEALIDAVGGSASLYGMSSGAMLALEAANKLGGKVRKIALYEPPVIVDDSHPIPADYVEQLNAALANGDRGRAVEIFMTKALGIPDEYMPMMRNAPPQEPNPGEATPPTWAEMEAVAHTLPYDGTIMKGLMQGEPLPEGRWSGATMPTVVIVGGDSEPFFQAGTRALVENLPNAAHRVLEGQGHAVAPYALTPVLAEFLRKKD